MMKPIDKFTINKKINIIIVRLGQHLISKTTKTNLNKDFHQLLNLLLEYPFENRSNYQKFQKMNSNLLELLRIEEAVSTNELTNVAAEFRYLDLYYEMINTFLELDNSSFFHRSTYHTNFNRWKNLLMKNTS